MAESRSSTRSKLFNWIFALSIALIIIGIYIPFSYNLILTLVGLCLVSMAIAVIIFNIRLKSNKESEQTSLQDLSELEGLSESDLNELHNMDIYEPADLLKEVKDLDVIAEFTEIPEYKLKDWVQQIRTGITASTPKKICPYCRKKITAVGEFCPVCGNKIK
jgi:hypothetical protein